MLCLVYLYTYLNIIKTQGILQVALDQQGPNGGAGFRPRLFLTAASESKPAATEMCRKGALERPRHRVSREAWG